MSERLKLPAYGKQLIALRRSGAHPMCAHVNFGFKWKDDLPPCIWSRIPGVHPVLCVRPDEYNYYRAPIYDFRCVTGLNVALFDQDARADLQEVHCTDGEVRQSDTYYLAGELARHAAGVEIHSRAFERLGWRPVQHIDVLALGWRDWSLKNNPDKNHGWPQWWSEETERAHRERKLAWLGGIDAWLAERFGVSDAAPAR